MANQIEMTNKQCPYQSILPMEKFLLLLKFRDETMTGKEPDNSLQAHN
jgi:hypothetical protein